MDEVSVVAPSGSNLSDGGFWNGANEEDAASALSIDANDDNLWPGNFVPPPPRPLFLDDTATPDGLTTCDLCSWAWQNSNAFTLDTAMEVPGEISWVLTLVIVSVLSAAIGAVVMIIVLQCRRAQSSRQSEENGTIQRASTRNCRPPINTPDDKSVGTIPSPAFPPQPSHSHVISNNGVWSWLSCGSAPVPSQLDSPTSPTENHYTHMDEALYAELDQESNVDSNSPAYQNSAYTDPDTPSSAYYSDLSVTTLPDRAYEVVGLSTLPVWENGTNSDRRQPPRLASISETVSVPSDYV